MSKKSMWSIPKNAANYFSPTYDNEFQKEHPVLYILVVIAIIIIIVIPVFIFLTLVPKNNNQNQPLAALFGFIGIIGALSIGAGLENIFMLLFKQYLGHLVTLVSIGIGLMLDAFSLLMLSMV